MSEIAGYHGFSSLLVQMVKVREGASKGYKMVRRLVKENNVRLLEGDFRKRNPTFLTTCNWTCLN
jgi:hypothetical protein